MADLEAKEKSFIANLEYLRRMDELITRISKNYDDGTVDIAYAKFQNEHLHSALLPTSHKITPAFLTVRHEQKGGKEPSATTLALERVKPGQLRFNLPVKNQKQDKSSYLLTDCSDYESEQQTLEEELNKQQTLDAINNFPVYDVHFGVTNGKKKFEQALEDLIELANVLREIQTKQTKK